MKLDEMKLSTSPTRSTSEDCQRMTFPTAIKIAVDRINSVVVKTLLLNNVLIASFAASLI